MGVRAGRAASGARAAARRDEVIVRATIALIGCGIAEIILALAMRWLTH